MIARQSELVEYDDVTIETYVDGSGPAVVILPSYGRDGGEDYDAFTRDIVKAGFMVLRPQPRGVAGSTGPMTGVTMHDLAADVATVVRDVGGGSAIVLGHAFGNFVARMMAVDAPDLVRGVILAAAEAKHVAANVADTPAIACDMQASDDVRLEALRLGFFAPGHDAAAWLSGWYPETFAMQRHAAGPDGTPMSEYWTAGDATLLEVLAEYDPFRPKSTWGEMRELVGDRVTSVVVEDAGHALFPEQPAAIASNVLPWMKRL